MKPVGFVICVGGLDASQVTVCLEPTVHTEPVPGRVTGGAYTSRETRTGAERTDKGKRRAKRAVMKSVKFIVGSLRSFGGEGGSC